MAENPSSTNWLSRLSAGLARSSGKIAGEIGGIFTKTRLDENALERLEEALIEADLGPTIAARLVEAFSENRFGKDVTDYEVKQVLADQIEVILRLVAKPLTIDAAKKPFVVLVVGVNGTGKTTTIGKLAKYYKEQGLKVMMAAGDTFRAAAISQLKIWGERAGVPVVAAEQDGDAAALAFRALEEARKEHYDLLLIDTAGRLHNKNDLMQELAKIARVLKKLDASAPHAVLLTLDATTGQNALSQVEIFRESAQVTGLVVTKLDGSAKGGVLVALADRFGLPIVAIGVGEGADDLQPFKAADFARALVGLDG